MGRNPLYVLVNIGCIYYEQIFVAVVTIDEKVVYDSSLFVGHHAIEALAVVHFRYVAGKNMVDILCRFRAGDFYFAHM